MNQIQQLINQMCPNGVEWKTLGEVAKLERGVVISKEYLRDNAGDYPVYSSQTENNGEFGKINTYRYNGAYVTWTTDGAYAGTVFRRYGKFNITNVCGLINILDKDSIDVNYLYYILSITTKKYVNEGMGNPKLMSNVMAKVKIPLPPLAIQTRIVEILDHFTNLTANLPAELNLRRKQFEHYREKLLSLDGVEGVEWKKLGEVCEIKRGKRLTTKQLDTENGFPVYHGGIEPIGFYHSSNRPANTVMVINVGASAGTVGFCDVDFWSSDGCFCICQNDNIRSKYLFYHLIGCEHQLKTKVRHAGIPTLDNKVVESVTIPIPPLAVQHSIVSILDKFTVLIENIEKELALRQKQYEYYREELLRFGG